jgi:hypothetical protein
MALIKALADDQVNEAGIGEAVADVERSMGVLAPQISIPSRKVSGTAPSCVDVAASRVAPA